MSTAAAPACPAPRCCSASGDRGYLPASVNRGNSRREPRTASAQPPARPPTGHSFYSSLGKTHHLHALPPGAGTNPGGGFAAWSMTPGAVSGRAREPPAAGRRKELAAVPSSLQPPGLLPSHLHQPLCTGHASARVGHPCVEGRREPETKGCLCSTGCWEGPQAF